MLGKLGDVTVVTALHFVIDVFTPDRFCGIGYAYPR